MTIQNRQHNSFYEAVLARGEDVIRAYRAATPRSAEILGRAKNVFPGGYTRDAFIRQPYTAFVESAQGANLRDADGRQIKDFWFNATSLPHGHAHPAIVDAIAIQAGKGTAYYAPTTSEIALAEILLERLPGSERIRFANSGSEAVMMAIRFARAATGRSVIAKFEGSYHGSYDDVSWSVTPAVQDAGSPKAPAPLAGTSGLAGSEGRVLVLPFNDTSALRRLVEQNHEHIAALLVEPLANRIGLILPDHEFLKTARELCDRYGIILIFDEVISFRAGYNGAQGLMGVSADITTMGKIIGGGFPVGALAGKARLLDLSEPGRAGRVEHAGTFNANPMVAVAGRLTMEMLTPQVFDTLAERGDLLRSRLRERIGDRPLQVSGAGSLFKITAVGSPISNYRDAAASNKQWEAIVSLQLLTEGFLLTPTLAGCISTVTTDTDIDTFIDSFGAIALKP